MIVPCTTLPSTRDPIRHVDTRLPLPLLFQFTLGLFQPSLTSHSDLSEKLEGRLWCRTNDIFRDSLLNPFMLYNTHAHGHQYC